MSPELLTLGMFGSLVLAIVLGVSLSYALGGIAVIFTLITVGPFGLLSLVSATFNLMWSILLGAIPFFIFMGVALASSQISRDLYHAFYLWSGRMNGGLLFGTAGFAATLSSMTGNCAASTITTGMIGIPSMEKYKYRRSLVLGTIGAAGTLGILIPPSITLIVIGMTTGLSVGRLFLGGLVAGMIALAAIVLYVAIRVWLQPSIAPGADNAVPLRDKVRALRIVLAPVIIVGLVLGSIFAGMATPTEAAGVGAAAVVVATLIRGEVNWRFIQNVTYSSATTTGMVLWIIFGAGAFVTVYEQGGGILFMQGLLLGLDVEPITMILLMQLTALVLGMFLDPIGIILLLLPIFIPIVINLGYDPIWFSVVFQLNLCIGYITPPFGYNIFYLKSLVPETPIMDIYKAVLPFVFVMILAGLLLILFPGIITSVVEWGFRR
ncbi:tripartite ATP-independent transporter DctM subunit [Natronocella acetinitrilica]|uniref:Tripartite ATP-independent transporter DctM subunit n=1 Tax=Natronocella acetinitrilica TaxID=414046 RepID=A0AAE3G8W5_9GAMM|nr:TRAP transporter large permease subunit [Natronocella acetinitrilica]MCP1677174.1 tripartite ATP-independent transporter DctM subunit [Natronocella acetinitrilica]